MHISSQVKGKLSKNNNIALDYQKDTDYFALPSPPFPDENALKALRITHWSLFAWHGIQLQVPTDWNPGQLIGDAASGNARLDDAEIVRLEVEWKDARGDSRVAELLDRYVEGLAKEAEKRNQRLQLERQVALEGLNVSHMTSTEYFVWDTGSKVHALACYSPASDRFLFVRVMCRGTEDVTPLLPTIFNSLTDTPREAAHTWELYECRAVSPPGFALESYELKSGHIRLQFQEGKQMLQVDRLSLGRSLLKSRTLSDWYRDFFHSDIRHLTMEIEDTAWRSHDAIRFQGTPRSRWRALLQPLPFFDAKPTFLMEGLAWFCQETNKIYAVQGFWKKGAARPDMDAAFQEVTCHGLHMKTAPETVE